MLYVFTNRRRAKDAIMVLLERYVTEGLTVFVREGLVYVDIDLTYADQINIALIMHYAQLCQGGIEHFLDLEKITELYRKDGIQKFRV